MATYQLKYKSTSTSGAFDLQLRLNEFSIYGSSRVGVLKEDTILYQAKIANLSYSEEKKVVGYELSNESNIILVYSYKADQLRGKKQYELSNHLGNLPARQAGVLVTISDRKYAIDLAANGTTDYYQSWVLSVNDYYAFGSGMSERSWNGDSYRYGFNTQEKDDEIYGEGNATSAEFWQYDARLARRWNVDPVIKVYESSYSCFSGNPIWYSDFSGNDTFKPQGFREINSQSGVLPVPINTVVEYKKKLVEVDAKAIGPDGKLLKLEVEINTETINSFTIGNRTYTAKFDFYGKCIGYFWGNEKYEPIKIIVDCEKAKFEKVGSNQFSIKVPIQISGIPIGSGGVKFIQTFSGNHATFPKDGGGYIDVGTREGNKSVYVDGSTPHNSPYVKLHKLGIPDYVNPYYISKDNELGNKIVNYLNGKTTANVYFYDAPKLTHHTFAEFNTIIVITNYMNSGRDISIGCFTWGMSNSDQSSIGGGPCNNFGPIPESARSILKLDYKNYLFFGEN